MPLAAHLPWTQVLTYADSGAVALLPVGATEAHGPHLPLGVDCLIAEEVCRRVAVRLSARGESSLTFPPVYYGVTEFAASFAGTVTTSAPAALAYLTDVIASIGAFFRRVAILNHHLEPAHFKLVHQAAQDAAKRTGSAIVVPDHRRKPIAPLLGEEFSHGGSHAGTYETSLMLAIAPTLVDESARKCLPDIPIDLPAAIKAGARDFRECGGDRAYFGSPAGATAAEGERLLAILAESSEQAILQLAPRAPGKD
jgi:creatinine amidohydrolase